MKKIVSKTLTERLIDLRCFMRATRSVNRRIKLHRNRAGKLSFVFRHPDAKWTDKERTEYEAKRVSCGRRLAAKIAWAKHILIQHEAEAFYDAVEQWIQADKCVS